MPISIRIEFPVAKSHFEGFGYWISTLKKECFDCFVVLQLLKITYAVVFRKKNGFLGEVFMRAENILFGKTVTSGIMDVT